MIIHGRTTKELREGIAPFARARVRVAGIWKNLSNLAETEASPPNVVFLHPPLYSDHPAGTPCTAGVLYPAFDSDTVIEREAEAGINTISVAKPAAFQVGDLLRIGSDPWREEVAVVLDVSSGVRVSKPLLFRHRPGTSVQKLWPDWEEPHTTLQLRCFRGTSTIFVSDLASLRTGEYVRIGDELHRLDIYEAESNDFGFYQLPPLQRVVQVELEASAEGRRAVVKFQPDFSLPRNQVDIIFKNSQTPDSSEENYA